MSVGRKGGVRQWYVFLCLIASSRWIFEDAWPRVGSTLRSEAWGCGVAVVVALLAAIVGRTPRPGLRSALALLAVGGGVLAVPAFGAALSGPASDSFDRTVAMCFVPTIVSVLSGVWGDGASGVALWPGLAGLGGALLVFPLTLPTDVRGYVGLLAPAIVVAASCVACRRVARGVAAEWSAGLLFAGGAMSFTLLELARMATSDVPEHAWPAAVAIDTVLAALAVGVVLRLDASKYAARYFAVPLLTIVEGLLILREGVTLRLCAGLALLAVSVAALLRARGTEAESSKLGLT